MSAGNYVLCNWKLLTVLIYKAKCSPKQGRTDWCLFRTGHMVYNRFLTLDLCPVYSFCNFSWKYDLVVTLGFEKLI